MLSGVLNFIPKYMVQEFGLSQSDAALYGSASVLATAVGIASGSVIIKRFKLKPRHLGIMTIVVSIVYSMCLFIFIKLGCYQSQIHGLFPENTVDLDSECLISKGCQCSVYDFSPVCDTNTNTNYLTPCAAGCTKSWKAEWVKSFGCSILCSRLSRSSSRNKSLFTMIAIAFI